MDFRKISIAIEKESDIIEIEVAYLKLNDDR